MTADHAMYIFDSATRRASALYCQVVNKIFNAYKFNFKFEHALAGRSQCPFGERTPQIILMGADHPNGTLRMRI